MKSFILALISFVVVSPVWAASSAPCGHEVFLSKVCVSSQTIALRPAEMSRLQCENPALHPHIYTTLQQAFEMSPAWFRHRLCGLHRVGIYNPDPKTVLSWSFFADGGSIGISKTEMDNGYELQNHAATMMKHAKKNKTIPRGVEFPEDFGYQAPYLDPGSGVLYLLAHEMGHIIYNPYDEAARKNSFYDCYPVFGSLVCTAFKNTQFGFIDWITDDGNRSTNIRGEIRADNQHLRSYVLADASVKHTPETADSFFRSLNSSSFVSAFSLLGPEEDFCETFAHVVMSESAKPLEFNYLTGEILSVWDRVRYPANRKLKDKVDFINRLMKE